MATIYIMCGLPGAGKSTYTNQCNMPVVSLDGLREEFYGDEAIQGNGRFLFSIATQRIQNYIAQNQNCVFDGTNCTRRRRKALMNRFEAEFICVWISTSFEECIRRNNLRSRVVPYDVIKRYSDSFQIPTIEEGFKKIIKIS